MYLLAPSILQNVKKKILSADPELRMCHFWAQNDPFVHYYHFHLTIGPFHCAKFKKILTADLELLGCTTFGPKMVHLPQFFLENYSQHSYLPIGPFHCAKF